jgi:hypothetical protein
MLLAEGILKFLEKYSERYRVEIYLVTLTSCDLFIINLASNYARGNREEFWKCLVGFMRRHLATKSSDTQQCNLKEWKKTAKDFGLTDGAISAASGKATPEVKNELKKIIKKLKEYLTTSKADLPVIVRNEKKVDDIPT